MDEESLYTLHPSGGRRRGERGDAVATTLWAPHAWLHGAWRARVLLRIGSDGRFAEVSAGVEAPPDATHLAGPVLPGMVDAHSHAFQRAFAGLAERRDAMQDDFWCWRDRMYEVASRLTPEALGPVAAQLYAELLQGGYTQVCEFHYLHHAPDGRPYPDRLSMAKPMISAAQAAGIGLTLLPVLYERGGFDHPALHDQQRRFAAGVDDVLAQRKRIGALGAPHVACGVAVHSLRAARPDSIARLARLIGGDDMPVHIHVAEQASEVEDCLAATGQRPIEWLGAHVELDARWHLVHATHASPQEIDAVADAGAGIVLCPTTEANLGDGMCDLPAWLGRHAAVAIGSDSQVGRSWPHELRLLEYGQRLLQRRRNVAAAPELWLPSTATRLFNRCVAGGAAAAGFEHWGLVAGARADLLVVDVGAPGMVGIPSTHTLDALVFSTDRPAFRDVWVAGRHCVAEGRHVRAGEIAEAFAAAMHRLWPEPETAAHRVAPS